MFYSRTFFKTIGKRQRVFLIFMYISLNNFSMKIFDRFIQDVQNKKHCIEIGNVFEIDIEKVFLDTYMIY